MEERSKLQKAVLISMAAMVVLFGILTLISHVRKGVEFEGGLLRRTETEESVIYNGKVRGEQVEITVRAAGSGNLTEVDFRIGNRIQDDCTLETGLPPIQAEQLGPVEHIRITKNDSLLFEGGYDPEYGMGWYVNWQKEMMAYANVYAGLIIIAVTFFILITLLFKFRDHVLAWQKGVIKW